MESLPASKSCFVCGVRNSAGLHLRFDTDGTWIRTRFTPGAELNGFVGVVHGGILATVLDEIMSWACAVRTRRFGYCAELNVRFLAPARTNDPLQGAARLVENKRDRLYLTESELRNSAQQLVATATGKYMPVRDIDFATLAADFEGDPEQLQRLFGPG